LITAAAHGITPDRAARFGLELDDRDHPLLQALFNRQTRVLTAIEGRAADLPFRASEPMLLVPLYGVLGREEVPTGVLALGPAEPALQPDARWLADLLGHRLLRAGRHQAVVDSA